MFSLFASWRRRSIIQNSTISESSWNNAIHVLPILHNLSKEEITKLKHLAVLFLHYKSLEGAKGLVVSEHMSLLIALQACLPILELGFDWYDGWVSIIIYPAAFIPKRVYMDENGVEHRSSAALSGESWHKGPVILSWEDSQDAGIIDGNNLVIHEFTHKLDVLNGDANGFPPLHRNMQPGTWSTILAAAYENFQNRLTAGYTTPIDSYAAYSPAEFFAVFSEVFFERPDILNEYYPEVYAQFAKFYRQDTLKRQAR